MTLSFYFIGGGLGICGALVVSIIMLFLLDYKCIMCQPPRICSRYVDDTFVIQKEDHKQNFLEHIYSVDLAIKFAVEDSKEDGAIPFFYTIVKPKANGRLSITVYRKPTHTDQYLWWDSHHNLSVKYSIINTLTHRANTVCNKPELL